MGPLFVHGCLRVRTSQDKLGYTLETNSPQISVALIQQSLFTMHATDAYDRLAKLPAFSLGLRLTEHPLSRTLLVIMAVWPRGHGEPRASY